MIRDAGGITRNGLPVSQAKHDAWQRRSRQTAASKRAEKMRAQGKRPNRSSNDWPPKVRKLAAKRSGGICEVDDCQNEATELHHRKLRRHRDHRIENALHVCAVHHFGTHQDIPRSRDNGRLVLASADPARIVVQLNARRRVLLAGDGTYREAT